MTTDVDCTKLEAIAYDTTFQYWLERLALNRRGSRRGGSAQSDRRYRHCGIGPISNSMLGRGPHERGSEFHLLRLTGSGVGFCGSPICVLEKNKEGRTEASTLTALGVIVDIAQARLLRNTIISPPNDRYIDQKWLPRISSGFLSATTRASS